MMDNDRLRHEVQIVWLGDITRLDYGREAVWNTFPTRQRRPSWRGREGRLVGCSTRAPNAPHPQMGLFTRRVFWVRDYDRDSQPRGVYQTRAL
jgi:Family of unknown function (DUF6009)